MKNDFIANFKRLQRISGRLIQENDFDPVYNQYQKTNGGCVINIICDMFNGFPMMSHTGAARAAVENLTRYLGLTRTFLPYFFVKAFHIIIKPCDLVVPNN